MTVDKKIEKVIVYTDGSCEPNPGPGGWAALILEDGRETILKGFEKESTNNRMEMTAALEALRNIDPQKPVLVYTDSQYLKNGVESWLKDWQAKNWKRKGGVLMNVDLWKESPPKLNKGRSPGSGSGGTWAIPITNELIAWPSK